jgi:hypothetical protein
MFEPYFPVDKLPGGYALYWAAFKRRAAGASADEKIIHASLAYSSRNARCRSVLRGLRGWGICELVIGLARHARKVTRHGSERLQE